MSERTGTILPSAVQRMWAAKYLNIPFVDRGRTSEGLDCYGLVRLIYQEQLGIQIPDYTEHYTSVVDVEEITALLAGEVGTRWKEIPLAEARIYDGLIFRIMGQPIHFALVLDPPKFLHILPNTRVSLERWDSILWQKRLVTAVRWKGGQTPKDTHVPRIPPPPSTADPSQPTSRIRMIAMPNLLHEHRIDRYIEPGGTVLSHMHRLGWFTIGLNARVFIDGRYIHDAEWGFVEPQAGQNLVMRVVPRGPGMGGGGGAGGGKEVLRIVGMLALLVASLAAPWLTPPAWGLVGAWTGAAMSSAVFLSGSLAMNAKIPSTRPCIADRRKEHHA